MKYNIKKLKKQVKKVFLYLFYWSNWSIIYIILKRNIETAWSET